jgi:hypothetical protein
MAVHEGGCICGALRYETATDPIHVTVCHCKFCQRATGSAYMVEPIFRLENLRVTRGRPTVYNLRSEGSGKMVSVHFCPTCGTKLYLTFERFTGACGIYAGTFDDPNWFVVGPENARHIFIDVARNDTILPPGIAAFRNHALQNDGLPLDPLIFDRPYAIGQRHQ